MKVMILGANGFLGSHLCNYLKKKNKVLKCGRNKNHDIVLKKIVKNKLSKVLRKTIPDVIINLIGLTNVDACEKKKKISTQDVVRMTKKDLKKNKTNYHKNCDTKMERKLKEK